MTGGWAPGGDPGLFLGTLDTSVATSAAHDWISGPGARDLIGSFILGSRHPETLMPRPCDGRPVALPSGMLHDDATYDYYPVDPTGLDQYRVGVRYIDGGSYINPVIMYEDMLAMTRDPETALASMGFGTALRLSALSRFRIGRLRNCTGASRRALFDIVVSHAEKGDPDRVLEIVARTAGAGVRIPDLGSILGRYGDLPAGFILEDLGVGRG